MPEQCRGYLTQEGDTCPLHGQNVAACYVYSNQQAGWTPEQPRTWPEPGHYGTCAVNRGGSCTCDPPARSEQDEADDIDSREIERVMTREKAQDEAIRLPLAGEAELRAVLNAIQPDIQFDLNKVLDQLLARPEQDEAVRLAAEILRMTGCCEKGHRQGTPHFHEETVHRWGQRLAALATPPPAAPALLGGYCPHCKRWVNADDPAAPEQDEAVRLLRDRATDHETPWDEDEWQRLLDAVRATPPPAAPDHRPIKRVRARQTEERCIVDGEFWPCATVQSVPAAPALDVERLAQWFHNKWESQGIACWHGNQHMKAWDCGRDAIEAAEYARLTD